jgi:hypothetical protein
VLDALFAEQLAHVGADVSGSTGDEDHWVGVYLVGSAECRMANVGPIKSRITVELTVCLMQEADGGFVARIPVLAGLRPGVTESEGGF